eukprot:Awhi_evm1s1127
MNSLLRFLSFLLFAFCLAGQVVSQEAPEEIVVETTGDAPVDAPVQTPPVDESVFADVPKVEFQAEVNKLMKLIINSLYRNKDIFLREVISNAADALDKIRFQSLTDASQLGDKPDLDIRIVSDEANGLLHITDTGIGMTKENLEKNLGTIAHSGTAEFMDALTSNDDKSLIGQFGVGFYSTFLVADKVTVTSKNNDDVQYVWESDASSFKIVEDPREDKALGRGTTITLHMKEEAKDFLQQSTLEGLIKKYSQFVNFPIYLFKTEIKDVEVVDEEAVAEKAAAKEAKKGEDASDEEGAVADEDEDDEIPMKVVQETVSDYHVMNSVKPIWTRDPKEVEDEEYNAFFKNVFKSGEDPTTHMHFNAEGEISFKSLVYVPKSAPANALQEYGKQPADLKLYVRRVFITDDLGVDFFPKYLSFIRGIIDSDDLPLNVSRENLQQSKLLRIIRRKIVRKCLDMFKKFQSDEDSYIDFWKEYAQFLKMGIIEDESNRSRLAALLRFKSSKTDNSEDSREYTSFDKYIENMKEGQERIFYLPGQSMEEVEKSPLAEKLLKQGYEVFYFTEPLDEYVMQSVPEYKSIKFQNIAKDGFDLSGKASSAKKEFYDNLAEEFKPLTSFLEGVLAKEITEASISHRLSDSPFAIVAKEWGMSGTMQRVVRNQAATKGMADSYANQKVILEINPRHPVVKKLLTSAEEVVVEGVDKKDFASQDAEAADLVRVLFDIARVRSGYDLKDPSDFASLVERMVRRSYEIDIDAEVDEEPEFEDDVEEEEEEAEEISTEEEEVEAEAEVEHEEL